MDHYDWVVLGDHPAALLTAGLVARLGSSVLVLPLVPSFEVSLSPSGQCLDPEPNFLPGMGRLERTNGLLAECLNHLDDLSLSTRLLRQSEEVFPQVLTPSTRLALSQENARLTHELQREVGIELAESLGLTSALGFSEPLSLSFWRRYPSMTAHAKKSPSAAAGAEKTIAKLHDYLVDQSAGARGMSRYWFSPRARVSDLLHRLSDQLRSKGVSAATLEEVCSGIWSAATSMDAEDPALIDLIHVLALSRTGAAFKGGISAYRKFLLQLARQHGAQVPEDAECRRVFVEDGKLIGVQIANRGRMIGASGGIIGCSLNHLREYLILSGRESGKDAGRSNRGGLKKAPAPQGWRFTIALTVHAEAIPTGMSSRAIWKEKDAPPLEIEVAHPDDYRLSGNDHRLVFVRTWLPYTAESLEVDYQRLVASRMFRQLTELFPFLEFHVVRIYPDFRDEAVARAGGVDGDEFSAAYGFVTPEMIPENLLGYSGAGVGFASGVEGLYVASGESYPALGSFGATVAAIESMTDFLRQREMWGFIQ